MDKSRIKLKKFFDDNISKDDNEKLSRLGKEFTNAYFDEINEGLSEKQQREAYERRNSADDKMYDILSKYDGKYYDDVLPDKFKKALDITDSEGFNRVSALWTLMAYDGDHGTHLEDDYRIYMFAWGQEQSRWIPSYPS